MSALEIISQALAPVANAVPPIEGDVLVEVSSIPKHTLCGWTKRGDVVWKCRCDVSKKVGSLGKDVIAVAIGEPALAGFWAMHYFLKAQNIWAISGNIID